MRKDFFPAKFSSLINVFPSENKDLQLELRLTTASTKQTPMKCSQQQLFLSRSQLSTEPLIFKIGQELIKSVLKQYKQTVVPMYSVVHFFGLPTQLPPLSHHFCPYHADIRRNFKSL